MLRATILAFLIFCFSLFLGETKDDSAYKYTWPFFFFFFIFVFVFIFSLFALWFHSYRILVRETMANNANGESSSSIVRCTVCLDEVSDFSERTAVKLRCSHVFHLGEPNANFCYYCYCCLCLCLAWRWYGMVFGNGGEWWGRDFLRFEFLFCSLAMSLSCLINWLFQNDCAIICGISLCIQINTNIHTHIRMYGSTYVHMYVCINICTHARTRVHTHAYRYVKTIRRGCKVLSLRVSVFFWGNS